LALAIYLLALMTFFAFFLCGNEDPDAQEKSGSFDPADLPHPLRVVVGAASVALPTFILVRLDNYTAISLIELSFLCVLFFVVARREPSFDDLPLLAAILAVATLAT
jgi:hypothetical protein